MTYLIIFLAVVTAITLLSLFYHPIVLKKWFVIIFAPPGNCKSLEENRRVYKLIREYYRIEKRYPQLPHRFAFVNEPLTGHIEYRFLKRWRNPQLFTQAFSDGHLRYWKQPADLRYCPLLGTCWKCTREKDPEPAIHDLHDCDIFCGEGATLFPATMKNAEDDLPLWCKAMLAQHRHRSLRFVLLTQDFMGINIAARRCCWQAWAMEKKIGSRDPSPSLPPVKFIWGWYNLRKIDPDLIRKDAAEVRLLIKTEAGKKEKEKDNRMKLIGAPRYHWISNFKCKLYDTLAKVEELKLIREIEHIEVKCNHVGCGYVHRTHKLK